MNDLKVVSKTNATEQHGRQSIVNTLMEEIAKLDNHRIHLLIIIAREFKRNHD